MEQTLALMPFLNNFGQGIIILDGQKNLVYLNKWILKHSDIQADASIGQGFVEVFPAMKDSRIDRAIDSALSQGLPSVISSLLNRCQFPLYLPRLAKDKENQLQQHVEISRVQSNDAHYCLINIVDMTASNLRESSLNELMVKLRQAKDEAAQANRAKSAFLACISHELLNPMNGVIGMSQLLRRTELSPKQLNYLQHIKVSSELMLSLLKDIRDTAKIESGNLTIKPTVFDLPELVNHVFALVECQGSDKNVDMKLSVAPELSCYVQGDEIRLQQILLNLLGNAVKFTADQVELTVQPVQDSDKIQFTISDNGIGMSAEELKGIFQPFAQANATIARRFGGSGLGLSISSELTKLMGGSLKVESKEGQGSQFTLILPLVEMKPVREGRIE